MSAPRAVRLLAALLVVSSVTTVGLVATPGAGAGQTVVVVDTTEDTFDPAFPRCGWKLPAGSPDPYSYQFKAVATRGDECPTGRATTATARSATR